MHLCAAGGDALTQCQLIDQYRQMGSSSTMAAAAQASQAQAAGSQSNNIALTSTSTPLSPPAESPLSADTLLSSPEDGRRTKQNRVHKREKELCGFVTPLYLPLLEASPPPPAKRRKEKKRSKDEKMERSLPSPLSSSETSSPSREPANAHDSRKEQHRPKMIRAESSGSSFTGEDLTESETSAAGGATGKKPRRPAIRKSSLRNNTTPKARRKRVSIVIDDRVVLPADNVFEAPMLSPSGANSAVPNIPGDDVIDPRLIDPPPANPVHSGPVHHSLPYPIAPHSTSPSKIHKGHILMDSPPSDDPPQTNTRTYLDPPPGSSNSIPQHASGPVYANYPEMELEVEDARVEAAPGFAADEEFDTYVGGLSGSNVDNVNQAGSYGYPSSLGASYLESYMASRPLSVRMAAAEKAGLAKDEKKRLLQDEAVEDVDTPITEHDVMMGDDADDDDGFGNMDDINVVVP